MTNEKLPPDFKKKWIEALRSGEYKQGKDVMYNPANDSLCCLAVAGLICGLTKDEMTGVDIITTAIDFDDVSGKKMEVSKRAVEELNYPVIITANSHTIGCDLAKMNDTGKSFSEIADWIEENL